MNESYTGRTRLRHHKPLFRRALLVLQVEVRLTGTDFDSHGGARPIDLTRWRDARAEDQTLSAPFEVKA